ncbi:hypothetical protein IW137_002681, partial [Coemansia sp. RSA 1287]
MSSSSETAATLAELKAASAGQLRRFYAAKASVNPNLSTPSIPPTITKIYADTLAEQGQRLAVMS